jgi:hypothetical protein
MSPRQGGSPRAGTTLNTAPYLHHCYYYYHYYRPLSLLPIVSQVYEKLLLKRLFFSMVENNGLIAIIHFGFRQRHSTIQQIYRIIQRINEALENKHHSSAAFLDISQAFDKVWHTGLLYKLRLPLPLN